MILPAPALAEVLAGTHRDTAAVFQQLRDRFTVPPLDAACASIAAEIERESRGVRLAASGQVEKNLLRVDCMILAIAIRFGCSQVVTTEVTTFRAIARGRVAVIGVPAVVEQQTLFAAPE